MSFFISISLARHPSHSPHHSEFLTHYIKRHAYSIFSEFLLSTQLDCNFKSIAPSPPQKLQLVSQMSCRGSKKNTTFCGGSMACFSRASRRHVEDDRKRVEAQFYGDTDNILNVTIKRNNNNNNSLNLRTVSNKTCKLAFWSISDSFLSCPV